MAFEAGKYNVIDERVLGQVPGIQGEVALIKYQYAQNPVSIKAVVRGTRKNGEVYERKLVQGAPVEALMAICEELILFAG